MNIETKDLSLGDKKLSPELNGVEGIHAKDINSIHKIFYSSENGLSEPEALSRIKVFKENKFSKKSVESLLCALFKNMLQPTNATLLTLSAVHLYTGGTKTAAFRMSFPAFFTGAIFLIPELYNKFFKPSSDINFKFNDIQVIRDGHKKKLNSEEITLGDIIYIETNIVVPADARIIKVIEPVKVDESTFTGESEPVDKEANTLSEKDLAFHQKTNMVFAGSTVQKGAAYAIVVAIGDKRELAKNLNLDKKKKIKKTPLQEEFSNLCAKITMGTGIIATGSTLYDIFNLYSKRVNWTNFIKNASFSTAELIIKLTPISLIEQIYNIIIFEMARASEEFKNVSVNDVKVFESLGYVNAICIDKTGTLTQNKMEIKENHYIDENQVLENISANVSIDNNNIIGNSTDKAIHDKYCDLVYYKQKERVFEFTSSRKIMSSIIKKNNSLMLYSKGAPEVILSKCVGLDIKIEIINKIREYEEKGYRVIAFSHRDITLQKNLDNTDEIERDMVFDGVIGIEDPLRSEARHNINECIKAGIKVSILTGDSLGTARAIALKLGLDLTNKNSIFEATEIDNMSDDKLIKILDDIKVVARCTPDTKARIVTLLKKKGNKVAVTGDGINDIKAFEASNVSFVMNSGNGFAKAAAGIIIKDNSFNSITNLLNIGRKVRSKIEKFIQFSLTKVFASTAIIISLKLLGMGALATAINVPINLLFLSFLLEIASSILFYFKELDKNCSSLNNKNSSQLLISREVIFNIFIDTLSIVLATIALLKSGFIGGAVEHQPLIAYSLGFLFHFWNSFYIRESKKEENIFNNKKLLLDIFIAVLGIATLGIQTLPIGIWISVFAATFSLVIFKEIIKNIKAFPIVEKINFQYT